MKTILTNKYNLPETLVDALSYDTHRMAGDISVTQLIDAPQIRILKRKHQLTEDVSEKLWALLGTAMHHILERANIKNVRKRAFILVGETLQDEYSRILKDEQGEEGAKRAEAFKKVVLWLHKTMEAMFPEIEGRYVMEMTLRYEVDGMIISGTFDIYDKVTKTLFDYKVTSVWSYMYPDSKKSWLRQMNIYALMLRQQGYEVLEGRIVALFRDWSGQMSKIKSEYPERHIMEIPIEIHESEKIHKYIFSRVKLHQQAEQGVIPECTGDERWGESETFAWMTPGVKRAVRRLDTMAAAKAWKEENGHKHKDLYLEMRPGSNRRCEDFCPVREVCEQRKTLMNPKKIE